MAADVSEAKVSEIYEDEVKQALRYVFVLIGLETIPEDAEKAVLLNHIYRNYKNYNPTDIRTAFELGIEDRLGISPDEVIVKSFKKFSPAHFGKVMRAYKTYKAGVMQEARQALPAPDPYTDQVKERLKFAYYNDIILPMFWDYAETELLNFGAARVADVYDILIDHKFMSPTDAEKRAAFEERKGTAGSKDKAIELAKRDLIKAYFDAEKKALGMKKIRKAKENYTLHKLHQKANVLQHKQSKRSGATDQDR